MLVDSAFTYMTSELDSAISDHTADDIREFFFCLFSSARGLHEYYLFERAWWR